MQDTEQYLLSLRVAGIVVTEEGLLLVRQHVDAQRGWSLPGGRVERGEVLGEAVLREAVLREVEEETGVVTHVERLLYVAERPLVTPPTVHIFFELRVTGGSIRLPTNEHDENTIYDVRFVAIEQLGAHGFSQKFMDLVNGGFPGAGGYVGDKDNLGL